MTSTSPLTFNMKTRLSCILYAYMRMNELNEFTQSHLDHATFVLSIRPNELYRLAQYKFDIQLAIDFHRDNCGKYPKNTYTKLHKIINSL